MNIPIRLIPIVPSPTVGFVIGTYATSPYIHLQLEARRRFYPSSPMLIHDDSSSEGPRLQELCEEYGAEFISTEKTCGPTSGDMACIAAGLRWGAVNNLDLLVKLSRRFLPLCDLPAELRGVAAATDYPTFSHFCPQLGIGFSTWCIGMHVDSWLPTLPNFDQHVADRTPSPNIYASVESCVHQMAQQVHSANRSGANIEYERLNPPHKDRRGYGPLPVMEGGCSVRSTRRLWHDCDRPETYYGVSVAWGLPYRLEDFAPSGLRTQTQI